MPVFLLLASVVILCCVFFNKISNKLGIPMLLAFILLGMFFGTDGVVKIPFDNYEFAEQICSVALIFIMFYGGFGTKWSKAKPVAAKAILLSTLGVVMTAGLTGLFCYFVLRIPLLESFLIGSVISSTDAASVFSILRLKKLNLKYNTASLLELESGSNDPCSYMLTIVLLTAMNGNVSTGKIAYLLFAQVIYGAVFGAVIAYAALWILKRLRFATPGFDTVFVLAFALLAYAAPAALGGNGYLSTYIVGIILGNSPIKNKVSLVHFFDGVTGLMQMLIFFLLGLLAFPSQLPQVMLPAFLIALFLTFIARPLAVFTILTPMGSRLQQQLVVSWSGLRGAASIVFAIMATIHPASTNHDIFHIVFCIVLFSILLQGSLIPGVARKLHMFDQNEDVFKTFTDYTDAVPIQFIQFVMDKEHPWVNQAIKDILLPPDTLLVLLQRGNEKLIPNGDTFLNEGDILVLSAKAPERVEGLNLSEITVCQGNEWIGKTLSEVLAEPDKLIIMIQRDREIVIPSGKTVLKENDILVMSQTS